MRVGWLAVISILLLVAPAHAWSQWQGGPERHGVIDLASGPLDIADVFTAHGANLTTAGPPGTTYVTTPEGVMALANDDAGNCVLLTWTDGLTGAPVETPLDACRHGSLQGFAAEQGLLAVCTAGPPDEAAFQLRDADTGRLVFRFPLAWGINALPFDQAFDDDVVWSCHGVAIDDESNRAIVPIAATRGGVDALGFRLVSVSLGDGDADVLYPIENVDNSPGAPLVVHQEDGSQGRADPAEFWPRAATVSPGGGIIVTGLQRSVSAGSEFPVPGLLWVPENDAAGPSGGLASVFAAPGSDLWKGSTAATTVGGAAVARVGDRIVMVDPLAAAPSRSIQLPVYEPGGDGRLPWTAPPVQHDGTVFLPTRSGIAALDGEDLSLLWNWPGLGRLWVVGNALATTDGEVMAILYDTVAPAGGWHGGAALVRIDAFTGQPVQALSLPLQASTFVMPALDCQDGVSTQEFDVKSRAYFCPDAGSPLHIVAGPAGITLLNGRGEAVHVGAASGAAPELQRSHAYPRAGELVTITTPLDDPRSIREVVIAWGDGTIDRQVPPEATTGLFRQVEEATTLAFTHEYREERDMDAAVTTVFDDGTTSTQTLTFHVGKTPPPDLNFMQTQFALENQDRTWGILGIAVALLGGLYAVVFRKRRHRRMRRQLQALDGIHERSLTDPEGALKELDAHHRHLRSLLMRGRIDDGEFRVVTDRAAGISKRLHRRLLGPLTPRLSPEYRGQIEAAFHDGLLSSNEARHLIDGLDDEGDLSRPERKRLRSLIEGWAAEFSPQP